MHPSPRLRAAVLPVLLATLAAACASGRSAESASAATPGRALRVRWLDHRTGLSLVLVNQSHTDRADLYSKKVRLQDAQTKVTTDEVLEEALRFFREQGFDELARPGAAIAGGAATQTLEIETPAGLSHADLAPGTPASDAKVFRTCRDNFTALYNSVYQLQAVDRAPDWQTPKATGKKQP